MAMKVSLKFLSVLLVLLTVFPAACQGEKAAGEIRSPAVAGMFYPGDSLELARIVGMLVENTRLSRPRVKPSGLICPHAGYTYSGAVASAGYKQLSGYKYSTVVVVAPSHQEPFMFSSVYCVGGYRTPLGTLAVDTELAKKIVGSGKSSVKCAEQGHLQEGLRYAEHSLEVQLPFLQVVSGRNVKIVPIVMGSQSQAACSELAGSLAEAVGSREDVLLVASTDLSHFHDYQQAERLDRRLAEYVKAYDYNGLLQALSTSEVEACGGGPMAAVMMACEKLEADGVRILAQANSGDVTREKDRVVGYLSAMLFNSSRLEEAGDDSSKPGDRMGLTDQEKRYLLKLAREVIIYSVAGGDRPVIKAITPTLSEKRGAFVTIKKKGDLRGCIGYIEAIKPLVETVSEMAAAAALRDHRFSPVNTEELDQLELEISVMSPICRINDPDEIRVGHHGLIIRRGAYQGLLLPQVATEYGWDRDTFLSHTCRKAGLPPDAWKMEDTEISAFSAEVFGED
jgi:MEMO1 family protein